jgi:hypothetical protein
MMHRMTDWNFEFENTSGLPCPRPKRPPTQRRYFYTIKEPRNRFQGIDYASLCSLAGWHSKFATLLILCLKYDDGQFIYDVPNRVRKRSAKFSDYSNQPKVDSLEIGTNSNVLDSWFVYKLRFHYDFCILSQRISLAEVVCENNYFTKIKNRFQLFSI